MIIVYILLAICLFISGFSIYGLFFVLKKYKETLSDLNIKLKEYEDKFDIIKKNNSTFISNNTTKYNELIMRMNSLDKILQTFNNGFTAREGYY